MEQRYTLLTLGVADLERSIAFYEYLGWRRSMRATEGVAFFQCGGVALSLYPRADLAKEAGVSDEGGGFRGVALAHNTRSREEVDTVLAEAEAAGGRIVRPAEEAFWGGYTGYFADPDGHLWEVAWNPGFPLDAEGNVTLPV
ncbi:VOC family protein [Minwuia thermotolerans]|uniref:Glyoxalase n=1 Tax=Minwuia thermotolerans TaxID=2056226 RepID=A0A2M9G1E6_9PROT|nr:VOC family protein [Minwuia thermotolerans]PJK29542.1 glyoxalase [Minwuia thermotolerans]